ncbi:MAG: hypothetical protein GX066_02760 [Clostridiaceae bacterium]|nr:hypothetical protein [Clostridiaceae bacterium]
MGREKKPFYKSWWFWVALIILIGIIYNLGSRENQLPEGNMPGEKDIAERPGQDDTQRAQDRDGIDEADKDKVADPDEAVTDESEQKDASIKAGMYKVGTDIASGEYILFSSGSGYYQVTTDSTGELDSIITNDIFEGTRYVTVQDGQYIEFRNSTAIPVDKAPVLQPKDGKYQEGMYKVGRDIKSGEYKVVPDGKDAYVEVSKDSLGAIDSIVTNDMFSSEKYITIQDGQYIKLVGCHIVISQ